MTGTINQLAEVQSISFPFELPPGYIPSGGLNERPVIERIRDTRTHTQITHGRTHGHTDTETQ